MIIATIVLVLVLALIAYAVFTNGHPPVSDDKGPWTGEGPCSVYCNRCCTEGLNYLGEKTGTIRSVTTWAVSTWRNPDATKEFGTKYHRNLMVTKKRRVS